MQRFTTVSKNFEDEGSHITKAGLIRFLIELNADSAELVTVIEFNTNEGKCGTARDVTEDIAREIANAFEFESDEDFDQEDIPAFALLHCEDEMRSDWLDGAREARTVASDQAVIRQAVA